MKLVVLAGGKGTRLGLEGVPKVMVPMGGVPLLERTLRGAIATGSRIFSSLPDISET